MLKTLSEKDIQRYAHQIILKNIGLDGQKKLLISKVFILGMGGLGSPVSMYLASAGIGTLGIADFDKINLSNIHRQNLYNSKDIGKYKVDVVKEKIKSINPFTKIKTYKKKITNKNLIEDSKKNKIIMGRSLIKGNIEENIDKVSNSIKE